MAVLIGFVVASATITAVVLVIGIAGWAILSVWRGWKSRKTHAIAAALICIAGSIVFAVTHSLLWSREFGVRYYATFAQVDVGEVKHYLPPAATKITVDRDAHRHSAQYTIEKPSLVAHVEAVWRRHPHGKYLTKEELQAWRAKHKKSLQGINPFPIDSAFVLYSPPEPDGGGCAYHYDEENGVAHQEAWYW